MNSRAREKKKVRRIPFDDALVFYKNKAADLSEEADEKIKRARERIRDALS